MRIKNPSRFRKKILRFIEELYRITDSLLVFLVDKLGLRSLIPIKPSQVTRIPKILILLTVVIFSIMSITLFNKKLFNYLLFSVALATALLVIYLLFALLTLKNTYMLEEQDIINLLNKTGKIPEKLRAYINQYDCFGFIILKPNKMIPLENIRIQTKWELASSPYIDNFFKGVAEHLRFIHNLKIGKVDHPKLCIDSLEVDVQTQSIKINAKTTSYYESWLNHFVPDYSIVPFEYKTARSEFTKAIQRYYIKYTNKQINKVYFFPGLTNTIGITIIVRLLIDGTTTLWLIKERNIFQATGNPSLLSWPITGTASINNLLFNKYITLEDISKVILNESDILRKIRELFCIYHTKKYFLGLVVNKRPLWQPEIFILYTTNARKRKTKTSIKYIDKQLGNNFYLVPTKKLILIVHQDFANNRNRQIWKIRDRNSTSPPKTERLHVKSEDYPSMLATLNLESDQKPTRNIFLAGLMLLETHGIVEIIKQIES